MFSSTHTPQPSRFQRSPVQTKPVEPRAQASANATATLVLIRGLPGSGKSTMASVLTMVGYAHFEADMYFERGGKYQHDRSQISNAHAWCQTMTRAALTDGKRVVVSNTFTRLRDLEPYLQMTTGAVQVIEATGQWKNIHHVPPEALANMARMWEPFPRAVKPKIGQRMN